MATDSTDELFALFAHPRYLAWPHHSNEKDNPHIHILAVESDAKVIKKLKKSVKNSDKLGLKFERKRKSTLRDGKELYSESCYVLCKGRRIQRKLIVIRRRGDCSSLGASLNSWYWILF